MCTLIFLITMIGETIKLFLGVDFVFEKLLKASVNALVAYIVITLEDNVSKSNAKSYAKKALTSLSDEEKIAQMLEYPPDEKMGDIALPCFKLSKALRRAPVQIAAQLADNLVLDCIKSAEAVNGYLNIKISEEYLANSVLSEILEKKENTRKDITNRILVVCVIGLAALFVFALGFNSLFHSIASGKIKIGGITWLGGVLGGFPVMVLLLHRFCPAVKGGRI